MEFKDLIKKRRAEIGVTLEDIGKIVGVSKATVQRWESGEIKNIRRDKIEKLSQALQTTPAYLMGWDENKSHANTVSLPYGAVPYNPVIHKIPILGYIAAGMPIYAEEHIEGYTYTERNGGAEYFALRVKGDSMNAVQINDGNLLIVRRQPTIENGEIAVVRVNKDNATVKRFKQLKSIIQLIPQSYNPEHQIQIYDLEHDNVEIIGKVVECKVEF